jgi:hypothetical protein
MNDKDHRPAEPGEDDKGKPHGFAGLARELNKIDPNRPNPISRQLVHKWWLFRHYNQFPGPVTTSGSGSGRPLFELEDVDKWYRRYQSTHGGRKLIERKPDSTQPAATSARIGQIAA